MNPILNRVMNKLGYSHRYGSWRRGYNVPQDVHDQYAGRRPLSDEQGNDLIFRLLSEDKPALVSRLGSVELSIIYHYHVAGGNPAWDENEILDLNRNAGFFPVDLPNIRRFCDEMFAHLHQVDLLAVWYKEGEEEMVKRYAPQAALTGLLGLEPWFYPAPWSRALAGKKVLMIHPFTDSVHRQYERRRQLFRDERVLPDFELKTIKAVQGIAGSHTGFGTWFDAYRSMCDQMLRTDFDVAIIGAGAYGMPLGSFAKSIGKKAVHMGGASQLLFGIYGNRWKDREVSRLFNEYWVRPSAGETPVRADSIEQACYW